MRARLAGLLIVAACVLGACGGDDGDTQEPNAGETPAAGESSSADEQQVRAVVREALTTDDPGSCTRLLTQAAVEQFTYRRGREAIAECRKDADEVAATSVAVSRVEVDGTRAEADAEPKGGGLTLRKATFTLRKDGRRWKIDRLKAGTLDRAAFLTEARKQMREPPEALSEAVTHCVVRELRATTDAVLIRIFVASDPRPLLLPTVDCALRSELPRTAQAAPFVTCVTQGARRELTSGALGRALAGDPDLGILESERFESVIAQIAGACARQGVPAPSGGSVS